MQSIPQSTHTCERNGTEKPQRRTSTSPTPLNSYAPCIPLSYPTLTHISCTPDLPSRRGLRTQATYHQGEISRSRESMLDISTDPLIFDLRCTPLLGKEMQSISTSAEVIEGPRIRLDFTLDTPHPVHSTQSQTIA